MKRTIFDVGTEIESIAANVATLAESLNSDENIPTKECIQKALHRSMSSMILKEEAKPPRSG